MEATKAPLESGRPADGGRPPLTVSVVIPCYRSEQTVAEVVRLARDVLVREGYGYEFVLVNDGSPDGTFARIRELCAEDPRVKGIDLVRNFGQHGAIMAGLNHTSGELVLLMDDDMQTHPSQIPLLLAKARQGWDVVFARYEHGPCESRFRRLGSAFAGWTIDVLASAPKNVYTSSFFVMRDYVRDNVVAYTGPYPYVQGLVCRATNSVTDTPVTHFSRAVGSSGYTLRSLVRLWSSIMGLSVVPLRLAAATGAVLSAFGLLWALVIVIQRLAGMVGVDGWASLMATVLVCSGLILLFLGLIGEYLGRLSLSVSRAPQYEVRSALNVPGGRDQDERFGPVAPSRPQEEDC